MSRFFCRSLRQNFTRTQNGLGIVYSVRKWPAHFCKAFHDRIMRKGKITQVSIYFFTVACESLAQKYPPFEVKVQSGSRTQACLSPAFHLTICARACSQISASRFWADYVQVFTIGYSKLQYNLIP